MGLIPPYYFDCVVAIGVTDSEDKFRGIASGFLYGDLTKKTDEGGKSYAVFLVTNRHVFKGLKKAYVRLNPKKVDEPARDYLLSLEENGKSSWAAHPRDEIDVAAIRIDMNVLKEQGVRANYFRSDEHVADIQRLIDLGIMEGDFVYVLGFPLGIIGRTRNTVIARSGIVARIKDALTQDNSEYLIDSSIFPGNSGGPVISKPEITAIAGTKAQQASYLIGIVSSYVTYRDEAISLQTKKTRIVFEENSGLAIVHPVDFIKETIKML